MTTARFRLMIFGLLLLGFLSAPIVSAQTTYGFENDPPGPVPVWPLRTMEGWFTPTPANTVPARVFAYATLSGLNTDPRGGAQGLLLTDTPPGSATRAQHDFSEAAKTATWTVSYDVMLANTNPSGTSTYGTDWIGSFSVMNSNPGHTCFTVLDGWDTAAPDSTWSVSYYVYDANGNVMDVNGLIPDAAWSGLAQAYWYRLSTRFDTVSNRILSVSITDPATNTTSTASPDGWYMFGGAVTFQGDSIRFAGFAPTNGVLIDNVSLDSIFERNLVVDGDGESNQGGDGTFVATIGGWTVTGSANVITYASGYDLQDAGIVPDNHGHVYFAGGPNDDISTLTQTIDLSSGASTIDGGTVTYETAAYLGGGSLDYAGMTVLFNDDAGNPLGTVALGPVMPEDRAADGLYLRRGIGQVPVGTRSATVSLQMTRTGTGANLGFADSVSLILHAPAAPESLLGTNLVMNGGAEMAFGAPANAVSPDIPGWVRSPMFSTDFYGDAVGGLTTDSPAPDDRGGNYFWGGISNVSSTAYQDIDVSSAASLIDGGALNYAFSAWLGGRADLDDNAVLTAQFMDWAGNVLWTSTLGPIMASDRNSITSLMPVSDNGFVPTGARIVHVQIQMTGIAGPDNHGMADNIQLMIGTAGLSR